MSLRRVILFAISGFLFFLPFLYWGNVYLVGGDDTKLYYVFPKEFITNYAMHLASNNTLAGAMTGYASVAYYIPIFSIFYLAKIIPYVSTQMLFYGIALSLGFLSFYLFLGLWLDDKKNVYFPAKIVTSLFYIFSPYLTHTLYVHQLLPLYLVYLAPLCLYLFIKGLRTNKVWYVLVAVVLFSLFSTTLNVLPWAAAAFLAFTPIIFIEGIKRIRVFLKHIVLAGLSFLGLNFYWLFHFINTLFNNTGLGGVVNHYSSDTFVTENLRIAMGVTRLFSPLTIPLSYSSTQLPNITFLLVLLSIIPFLFIISTNVFIHVRKNFAEPYYVGLVGFLASWVLFSPNLGNWGPRLFIGLITHVPFFIMFRNMYDKFSLPLAFYYAFSLCISLAVITSFFKRREAIIVYLLIISSVSFILGRSFIEYSDKVKDQRPFSSELNEDYMELASYLSSFENASHVLWLPLNGPTYANIEDGQYHGNYYSGLSPLQELTGMPDYIGRFSFIRPGDFFVGEKLFKTIEARDYAAAGKLFQQVNAKYIIVDHQVLPEKLKEFMYGGQGYPVLSMQNDVFKKEILGRKLKEFGMRYTVYEINPMYQNDKIVVSSSFEEFKSMEASVLYKKKSTSEYEITISDMHGDEKLFFLEPFDRSWQLLFKDANNEKLFPVREHRVLFDYANGWDFDKQAIRALRSPNIRENADGTINVSLILRFHPVKYNTWLYSISLLTLFGTLAYCLHSLLRDGFRYEKR